jgi:hypothetical protein
VILIPCAWQLDPSKPRYLFYAFKSEFAQVSQMLLAARTVPRSSRILKARDRLESCNKCCNWLPKLTACWESSRAADFSLRAKVSNLLASRHTKSIAGFCPLSRHASSSPTRVSAQPFIFKNLHIPEDPRACDTRLQCEHRFLSCELNSSNELQTGEGNQLRTGFSLFMISCSKELRPVPHTKQLLEITTWHGIWD